MQAAGVLLNFVLNLSISYWIVRADLRRLRGVQLARSWNEASFWAAVVGFNLLCIPVHFIKTRRSVAGIALGLFWLLAAVFLLYLANLPFEGL